MRGDRRVVVTGLGLVTPFGIGSRAFEENIMNGRSAASKIVSFDASGLPTQFAASVPFSERQLEDHIENQKSLKTMCRSARFAMIAAKEAVRDSGLNPASLNPYRFGTSLGAPGLGNWDLEASNQFLDIVHRSIDSSNGAHMKYPKVWKMFLDEVHPLSPLKALSNITTAHVAIQYNARGNSQTITTACTSSAQAIGEAFRQIKYGISDVVLAGGSDSMVNPYGLVAFSMLGVMSRNNAEYQTACRPFDKRRDGFMLGEGAAIFVLEEWEHCRKRGAIPYTEVVGYASTCDAFRLTDEPPDAWGIVEAMKGALADAAVDPESVNYINAHGTGTTMNDKTETFAIKKVFGESAKSLAVSSTKSMIGHLVSAAGAVEFAASNLALRKQTIPPTINYQEPDPECDLDYVPNTAREARLDVVLSNSFGFGGQNACLVIRRMK